MFRSAAVVALVVAALTQAGGPATAAAPPEAPACRVLPADNIWNTRIDTMPVHPRSATWLANMGGPARRLHPDFGVYPYGYPVQFVDSTTPRTTVEFYYGDESDPGPYPFTPATPIEPHSDRHAFMIDRDACVLYELFDVSWQNGRPVAGSGAVFDLRSNALRPRGWTSADAAGLPIYPGLVRYDEVAAGLIDHAIRFTAQRTDRSYVWPARHHAGAANDPNLPPMGARFRLRSTFDISRFSAETQVVLRAMQQYGLILADNGSNWFFQGQTDQRWGHRIDAELKSIAAGEFEAVDASSLMVDPDSGQARGAPGAALTPGWHSRWHSQSAYADVAPGQVTELWVRFRNTGTETWHRGNLGRHANLGVNRDSKEPYRLGMAAGWLSEDRVATTTAATVAPGEIAEFRFSVRAPVARGVYRVDLRPVIDGTAWMEDEGVFLLVSVR